MIKQKNDRKVHFFAQNHLLKKKSPFRVGPLSTALSLYRSHPIFHLKAIASDSEIYPVHYDQLPTARSSCAHSSQVAHQTSSFCTSNLG